MTAETETCGFGFAPNAVIDHETQCTLPRGHDGEHRFAKTEKPFDALIEWLLLELRVNPKTRDQEFWGGKLAVVEQIRVQFRQQAAEIARLKAERYEITMRLQSLTEDVQRRCIEDRIGFGETPCADCYGLGVKAYGSTATWRGGAGGQMFTNDVCDKCWGSGNAHRPWPSWREYESLRKHAAEVAANLPLSALPGEKQS